MNKFHANPALSSIPIAIVLGLLSASRVSANPNLILTPLTCVVSHGTNGDVSSLNYSVTNTSKYTIMAMTKLPNRPPTRTDVGIATTGSKHVYFVPSVPKFGSPSKPTNFKPGESFSTWNQPLAPSPTCTAWWYRMASQKPTA